MIAALFVMGDGIYSGRPDVEVWDEARDARLYDGPWPVVAHPPCARWGRYWFGSPISKPHQRKVLGADGGCFLAAVEAVTKWGGVLEHPAGSRAFGRYGLGRPVEGAGWMRTVSGGWSCHVDQGMYGHRARKATWLHYVGTSSPAPMLWGRSTASVRLDNGCHSRAERIEMLAAIARGERQPNELMGKRERAATPPAFAEALLDLARNARAERAA